MGLQTAFYIIGIIFMSLMILMVIALLAAVITIKTKVNKFHDAVDERVNKAKSLVSKVSTGYQALRYFVRK